MPRYGTRLLLTILSLFWSHQSVVAQKADVLRSSTLSEAEQALVDLMSEYNAESEPWFEALSSYETSEEREAALESREIVDPGERFIPQLLEFEAEHRGEQVGMQALRQVFRSASGNARFDSPANIGRREAFPRLAYYGQDPLLPEVVRIALGWKPKGYESVRGVCYSPNINSSVRDVLRYHLSAQAFRAREAQEYFSQRVETLRGGGEATWARELENDLAILEALPSQEVLDARCDEAMRTLEELAAKSPSSRFPEYEGVDDEWILIRPLEKSSKPTVAEKAAALMFKRRHLVIGAEAPELEVSLVDGTPWKLSEQVGKVVVIQFSFTGCGPCAAMYPDLAELVAKHPHDLQVPTILRDPTPKHAFEGIENGKFTWNINVDGDPGRIATKWSVEGFPTIYVVDKQGTIAAEGVRGGELKEEVTRMIAAE